MSDAPEFGVLARRGIRVTRYWCGPPDTDVFMSEMRCARLRAGTWDPRLWTSHPARAARVPMDLAAAMFITVDVELVARCGLHLIEVIDDLIEVDDG